MKNICEKCRKPVGIKDNFCRSCGSKFLRDPVLVSRKNELAQYLEEVGEFTADEVISLHEEYAEMSLLMSVNEIWNADEEMRKHIEQVGLDTVELEWEHALHHFKQWSFIDTREFPGGITHTVYFYEIDNPLVDEFPKRKPLEAEDLGLPPVYKAIVMRIGKLVHEGGLYQGFLGKPAIDNFLELARIQYAWEI